MTDKTPCRTPTGTSATNIPSWKFDAVRAAVLDALSAGPLPASQIKDAVGARLSEAELAELGALGWHATTVRLEMEVRGEIQRQPGVKPVTLERA